MNRITSFHNVDDLFGVAINQGNFTAVAQRGREDVGDVEVVHLLGGPVFWGHRHLPGAFHVVHAPLWWRGRCVLNVARHQVHLLLGQFARCLPIRHASRGAVGDEHFQILSAFVNGDVWRQGFACGTFA